MAWTVITCKLGCGIIGEQRSHKEAEIHAAAHLLSMHRDAYMSTLTSAPFTLTLATDCAILGRKHEIELDPVYMTGDALPHAVMAHCVRCDAVASYNKAA
jgi:hypothetical protein